VASNGGLGDRPKAAGDTKSGTGEKITGVKAG